MIKTRVMIVNDSRTMRLFLEDIINSFSDCELIRSCIDGNNAIERLPNQKPDVVLLDLEMPHMDGLTFLEMLPDNEKYPTIIVSNYAKDESDIIHDAMELGALDSIAPPKSNSDEDNKEFRNSLHHKIIKASLKSNRFSTIRA